MCRHPGAALEDSLLGGRYLRPVIAFVSKVPGGVRAARAKTVTELTANASTAPAAAILIQLSRREAFTG